MEGYWYIVALTAVSALIAIKFSFPLLVILVLCWIWLLYRKKRARMSVLLISISVVCFLFFTPSPFQQIHPISGSTAENKVLVTGQIKTAVSESPLKSEFVLEQASQGKPDLLVVYFPGKNENTDVPASWKRGAECRIYGTATIPDSSTNPGEFNYQQYLLQQNVSNQILIESLSNVSCTGRTIVSYIDEFRSTLMEKVDNELTKKTSGWMDALLFGEKAGLSEEEVKLFQEWGLSHLLAISGLHVGLISSIFYFFMTKGNLLTKEKAGSLLILALPLYIVIAGESASVWRAALMGTLGLLLIKLRRKMTIVDIISIVFLFCVIINPGSVNQLSFQFSFLVTFSLLLARKLFSGKANMLSASLSISLISQLAILPLQLDQFYSINPLSPLANLMYVPYFSLFVLPMMLMLLLSVYLFPFLISVLEKIFLFIHEKSLFLLEGCSDLYFPWVIGQISPVIYICYFIILALFMNKWMAGEKQNAFKFACLIVILFFVVSLKPYFSEQGMITILDIGQGDAIVIELPKRKAVMLIDTGGTIESDFISSSDKSYQQILKPFLLSKGITKIDAVFLTHPDLDHAGNFPYVKEDFTIDKILTSKWFVKDLKKSKEFQTFNFTNHHTLESHHRYNVDGLSFKVLSPDKDFGDANENSLVLLTELGDRKWLFTGDIEEKAERELIKNYPDLDIDILKVAHHGSKTSSKYFFLQHVKPETAVISVGRKNRYGHPASETIESLNNKGVKIYRTDGDGAVQYLFKQSEGVFFPFIYLKNKH